MNVFGRSEKVHQEALRLWLGSWKGLQTHLANVRRRIEAEEASRPLTVGSGHRTSQAELQQSIDDCAQVLANLQNFSSIVFDFLHRAYTDLDSVGFSHRKLIFGKSAYTGLFQEAVYPPGYILSLLLRQISIDLGNIERALYQRTVDQPMDASTRKQGTKVVSRLDTLTTVDALVRRAMAPALAAALFGEQGREFSADYLGGPARDEREISVVSYSAERVGIRLLPYCDAVLIGMPYSASVDVNNNGRETLSREFMAIPHEVGHLIFRQGTLASWSRRSTTDEGEQGRSWFGGGSSTTLPTRERSLFGEFGRWAAEAYQETKETMLDDLGELTDDLYWDVRNFVTNELGEKVAALCFEDIQRSSVERLLVDGLMAEIVKHGQQEEDKGLYLQQKVWIFDWLEEIFADAYGFLITGPKGLATFQEILATTAPDHATVQSHKHPIPVLRPLIHTQMYRTLHQGKNDETLDALISYLERQWMAQVEANWPSWIAHTDGQTHQSVDRLHRAQFSIDGQELSGQQILESVQLAINVVVSSLKGWLRLSTILPWTSATRNRSAKPPTFHFRYKRKSMQVPERQSALRHKSEKYMWIQEELDRLGDSPSLDEIVDVILFRGWTDEGPRAQDDR